MSLDSQISNLNKFGTVTIKQANTSSGVLIEIEGFSGNNCTCRDVAVQACLWAIGELQREVLRAIEAPGAGSIGVN